MLILKLSQYFEIKSICAVKCGSLAEHPLGMQKILGSISGISSYKICQELMRKNFAWNPKEPMPFWIDNTDFEGPRQLHVSLELAIKVKVFWK